MGVFVTVAGAVPIPTLEAIYHEPSVLANLAHGTRQFVSNAEPRGVRRDKEVGLPRVAVDAAVRHFLSAVLGVTGIAFTGRYARYGHADTWFPSWASNGHLYSSWTDGTVNGARSDSRGISATTGYATILGSDPLHLKITDVATYSADPKPYGGRYPAGTLVYDGVWFYGTYLLKQTPGLGLNWDILGPFVGFRWSTGYGRTWHPSPHTPTDPLFDKEPIKLGLLHFVDFAKNMEYTSDGKANLVSQGASQPDPKPRNANVSWVTGDQIYLARVEARIDTINKRSAYEYFAGHDAKGDALWTHDYSKI